VRLPDAATGVLEWAFPGAEQDAPCLRRVGAARMLCGLKLVKTRHAGFVPAMQPVDPDPFCARCVIEMWSLFGNCPVCGALVELVDRLVGGHGMAVRTRDGVAVLPEPCAGMGVAAEDEW
jgi:hypothetical protein